MSRVAGKDLENTFSSLKLVEPSRAVSFLLSFPWLLHGDHNLAFPCRCCEHVPPQVRLQSTEKTDSPQFSYQPFGG